MPDELRDNNPKHRRVIVADNPSARAYAAAMDRRWQAILDARRAWLRKAGYR